MNDQYDMEHFRTDTGKLWYAGSNVLPSLADKYADISYTIWVTRGGSDDAFASADSPSGKLPGIYAEWNRLRNTFQDILSQTSANLMGTAGLLLDVAEDLSATDADGAAQIADAGAALDPVDVSERKSSTDEQPPVTDPRARHREHGS